MTISLQTPVKELPRVGDKTAALLHRLGISTVKDLLYLFPTRYEDFRHITPLGHIMGNSYACAKVVVRLVSHHRSPRKRLSLTEALLEDATGSIKAVWFNQPYLSKTISIGDKLYVAGRVESGKYGIQFSNPVIEQVTNSPTHTARVVPIYPLTQDLAQKQLRSLIKVVLPLARTIPDPIPNAIRKEHRLMPLAQAITHIHFPITMRHAEQARERIALQELVDLFVLTDKVRAKHKSEKAKPFIFPDADLANLVRSIPFQLTDGQRRALWDIVKDMRLHHPMNRMLNGDVGSGKTILAHLAAIAVAQEKSQTAFLAPTDILAQQHFASYRKMFGSQSICAGLFTRTKRLLWNRGQEEVVTKPEMLTRIAKGEVAYLMGTHALLEPSVTFSSLNLVIVDEQHRFGVEQRGTLSNSVKQTRDMYPHYLSLTATPIPRSLARIAFLGGDISVLDQMPKGRLPIITNITPPSRIEEAYAHIRKEIQAGHQAFVVCPIIDPSDTLGVKAATDVYEHLSKTVFPDLLVDIIHGKQAAKKRDSVMDRFAHNALQILVATAVIEVGVDIPNATIMLIEGAERFGLAQLHQFRGRIGRSSYQSYCYAAPTTDDLQAKERLQAFGSTNDGFQLAQMDLKFRGPGTIFGTLQSGHAPLRIADIANATTLALSQRIASQMLASSTHAERKE